MVKHYYYKRAPGNWGDEFGPYLLQKICGIDSVHASHLDAELFSIGSNIELVPETFEGTILGAGIMFETTRKAFKDANVRLLRGKLTRERCEVEGEPLLGDPGLLAGLFAPKTEKKFRYGIIPHYIDADNPALRYWRSAPDVAVLDVTVGVQALIDQVAACESIVSSSLHGLILADALGIPCAWVELSPRVLGDGFKFRDYYSVFDENPVRYTDITEAMDDCRTRETVHVKQNVMKAVLAYREEMLG